MQPPVRKRSCPIYDLARDKLLSLHLAYENLYVGETNANLELIETDRSGHRLATIDSSGLIVIYEYIDEKWQRQAAWKYRGRRPNVDGGDDGGDNDEAGGRQSPQLAWRERRRDVGAASSRSSRRVRAIA